MRAELEQCDDGGLRGTPSIIAEESETYRDPLSVAILDSKAIFNLAANEQSWGECDEVVLIRNSL